MKTQSINTVSFQANLINKPNILKKTPQNVFKPLKVAFVEIEPHNPNDLKALDNVGEYWSESFAGNISFIANSVAQGKSSANDYKIYALTKQAENFDSLNPDDILGLAETLPTDKNKIHINYLQVEPEQVYKIAPDYNKIGSRILDSLKILYKIITLKPNSKGTANFYEQNGFKPVKENPNVWIWSRE